MASIIAFLMLFISMMLLILPYSQSQTIEKTKLKNELLANLNKYSEKGSDLLEPLGSPRGTDPPLRKEPLGTPPVPPPPSSATNGNGLFNLFQSQPSSLFSSLPNLFNGLLPLSFTTPQPLQRQLGIQPIPFGSRSSSLFRQHPLPPPPPAPPSPPPPPPLLPLPTLLPFFAQNGVPQGSSQLPNGPLQPLPPIDNVATVRPRFINYTTPPLPNLKSMSEAVSDNIRDWRQRFYKAFKKLSGRGPFPSTTFAPLPPPHPFSNHLKIQSIPPHQSPLSRPHSRQMQPVIIINDTKAPIIDKNRQILMNRNNPNWISDQKVKTYARDSKGRIVRLFGVESSGYRYNNSNTNGFIPIPDPPGLLSENVDIGPVYIPAARPSTAAPIYNSYPSTPPQINTYVAPPIPQPTSSSVYTVQMPAPPSVAPPPVALASYPSSTYGPLPPPRDEIMTQEVDGLEYDDVNNETPCVGCENTNLSPNDPWLLGSDNGIMENNEKCNSLRLRYIIQESIINSDAEASKRAIQLRAENELGSFYNVVCGVGFFSYIAHTDEFCQASSSGINCYVFSPVCSFRMQMGTGIARKRKVRRRKSFVNKN